MYRRCVVCVIESANRHHLVVAIKCAGSHFVDVDRPRDIAEFDGQDCVVALRVAIVVNPD
jgi:hypothetical protein